MICVKSHMKYKQIFSSCNASSTSTLAEETQARECSRFTRLASWTLHSESVFWSRVKETFCTTEKSTREWVCIRALPRLALTRRGDLTRAFYNSRSVYLYVIEYIECLCNMCVFIRLTRKLFSNLLHGELVNTVYTKIK